MKRLLWALAIVGCFALSVSPRLVGQSGSAAARAQEPKHYLTTLPDEKGRLRATANTIDEEWDAAMIHFKGSVRIEVWAGAKGGTYATVLRADAVDFNEKSGEFSATGNVRMTLEEPK